jgi:hypothetical protein
MKNPPVAAPQSEAPNRQQLIVPPPLPRWKDLPVEYQRELLMTLAAMLVKQLTARRPTQQGRRHE